MPDESQRGKRSGVKLAMSNLDAAASVDEMKQLCVGLPLNSLLSYLSPEGKDFFEIKFDEGASGVRNAMLRASAPPLVLGEAVPGPEPILMCTGHQPGLQREMTMRVRSATVIVSPFASVNGVRCHLKAMEVFSIDSPSNVRRGRKGQKPSKNKFADEVTTLLKGFVLSNVLQVAHDRVIAFQFAAAEDCPAPSSPLSYSECSCSICSGPDAGDLLSESVTVSCCKPRVTVVPQYSLFVELYAGNMILIGPEGVIVSVLYPKVFDKQGIDLRRREKGMAYLPYLHNKVSDVVLGSISSVVECASLMAAAAAYDAKTTAPPLYRLALEPRSTLSVLPAISAQFPIEVFAARSAWNRFCYAPRAALEHIKGGLSGNVVKSQASHFRSSLKVLMACLQSQLSLSGIDPHEFSFGDLFCDIFDTALIHPIIKTAIERVHQSSPTFWDKESSCHLSAKQRERCFAFTTTISNSNSVSRFLLGGSGTDSKEHVAQVSSHFTKTILGFFDQFRCRIDRQNIVPMSKVLVAFLLGIPIASANEKGFSAEETPPLSREGSSQESSNDCVLDLTSLSASPGDDVFEALKRCLAQFDNMGPVLAAHCLTYAWDDGRAKRANFQRACGAASFALADMYESTSDVKTLLENPIPCPSIHIVANAPAEVQLMFLTIQQSIHEIAEEATTHLPKVSSADAAPRSLVRALASIRLKQCLLHDVKPSSDILFEGINSCAAQEADVAREEAGPALANALLATNLREEGTQGGGDLTMKRCVEALFEASPEMPTLSVLSDSLSALVISQLLAPYVADACVLLHHRYRHDGNTYIGEKNNWVWAGYSYSPVSSGGATYFGEHSLQRAPSTFVSEEIQQLKRMLSTKSSTQETSEVQSSGDLTALDGSGDGRWPEVGTPNGDLGVASDAVLAYADADEMEEFVVDSIHLDGSPTLDTSGTPPRRGVTFSPSANVDAHDKRFPTRVDLKKQREGEARREEHHRLRFFTEQQVVINPFASDDPDVCVEGYLGLGERESLISDMVSIPEPLSSYESYYPALRCLSDVSFGIRDSVIRYRHARDCARERYELLGAKIESSKAYVAATCSKPFLFMALGYGKGVAKSSLRKEPGGSHEINSPDSVVTLVDKCGANEVLRQRLSELDRKKAVVIGRANRLYILPPLSPLGDSSPLRPPLQVSLTLPVALRSGIFQAPVLSSPNLGARKDLLDVSQMTNQNILLHRPAMSRFVDALSSCQINSLMLQEAQHEFFDFSGFGRSLEYFYTAAALIVPSRKMSKPADSPMDDCPVLSASADSLFVPHGSLVRKGNRLKASEMIENTLKKHEDRKNNLESTAKGYHINGNTLIAFADIVNTVLGTIATLVSQGSSWSAIEKTWSDRRKLLLDEVSINERQEMVSKGYDGRLEEYYERIDEWEDCGRREQGKSGECVDSTASDGFPEEPVEDDGLSLEYYFEHQDELDPSPSSKEQLIQRLYGATDEWLFRVVTSLNLAESSVIVSLPKVLEDDVPLVRDPEMIDIEVTFTETAYANANAIFKRKKDVDVKVSKARQADDLVREGAKRRALQKQQASSSAKVKANKSKSKPEESRSSFRNDVLYLEAVQCVSQLPQPPKIGVQKQAFVPVPFFQLPASDIPNRLSMTMSGTSSHTFSRSATFAGVGRADVDSILFKKDGSLNVPPVDHVKGVRVLSDSQDPLGDFDCKSFWFLTSCCDAMLKSCDASTAFSAPIRTSFLVLHPRDTTGAIKLLNDDLGPDDLVVYTDDVKAEGALPVVIKSRAVTVRKNGINILCRVSFPEEAIRQATTMLFARSRLWSQRCSGRAFWCYGAQLIVRSKEDSASKQGAGLVSPLVVDLPIVVPEWSAQVDRPRAHLKTSEASYVTGFQVRYTGARGPEHPQVYDVSYSCYFFDVVRGAPTMIPPSSQPPRLGIGLLFKERVDEQLISQEEKTVPALATATDLSCSLQELRANLLSSPLIDDRTGSPNACQLASTIRNSVRGRLWESQRGIRERLACSSGFISSDSLPTNDQHGPPERCDIVPFHPNLVSQWRPKRLVRQANLPKEAVTKCVDDGTTSSVKLSECASSTRGKSTNIYQETINRLASMADADKESAVETILKDLKPVPEAQLQLLLLYQTVIRKSKTMTKQERSVEVQRKKKDSKQQPEGKQKAVLKSARKGKEGREADNASAEQPQQVFAKSEWAIISEATMQSSGFIESVDKELKKMIKAKEGELKDDAFSESESDDEDVSTKGRRQKKGIASRRGNVVTKRHIGLRMLIADEVLRCPPKATFAKKPTTTQPLPPSSSAVPVNVGLDIFVESISTSRLADCWERELRWLTGAPQHYMAIIAEGGMGVQSTSVEYCIPIVAPLQSFNMSHDAGSDGSPTRYKYFVELQPSGQEKASSRSQGEKSVQNGKKSGGSNFKAVFGQFVSMVNTCIISSYRNDYWSRFLMASPYLSDALQCIDEADRSSGDVISEEVVEALSSLAWDYVKRQSTDLVSNAVEAAVMEQCISPQNSNKYFQRVWEVSTSVSETVETALQAVVTSTSPHIPISDSTPHHLPEAGDGSFEMRIQFSKRMEKARIDFISAIPNSERRGPASAFGFNVDSKAL